MSTAFPIQHWGANIEIYSAPPVRSLIQHADIDFDGASSLIRADWQEIILSLCVEALVENISGQGSRDFHRYLP